MVKAILHSHESKTLFLFKIKFDMYHIFTTINLKRLQKKTHYWDFCNPASTSHHYSSKPLFLSCFWVLWRLRFHTFSEFEAENLNFSYFFFLSTAWHLFYVTSTNKSYPQALSITHYFAFNSSSYSYKSLFQETHSLIFFFCFLVWG